MRLKNRIFQKRHFLKILFFYAYKVLFTCQFGNYLFHFFHACAADRTDAGRILYLFERFGSVMDSFLYHASCNVQTAANDFIWVHNKISFLKTNLLTLSSMRQIRKNIQIYIENLLSIEFPYNA